MRALDGAFKALAGYPQFILWRAVVRDGGRVDKVPVNWETGHTHNAHDPKIWLSSKDVAAKSKKLKLNIGFVFTKKDPFFFLDIDKCMLENGQWSPLALELLNRLDGCAVEISHSGKALHIFGTGRVPRHNCKNVEKHLELYTSDRFVALTGNGTAGKSSYDASAALPDLVYTYFNPGVAAKSTESAILIDEENDDGWTKKPVKNYSCTLDDSELIARACASKSDFKIFWENDEDAIAKKHGGKIDASSSDISLANRLLWWTGGNCERTRELMKNSALVRDKWGREKYLKDTIKNALSRMTGFYSVEATKSDGDKLSAKFGVQFLDASAQQKHFAGCVYITDMHRVFTPNGTFLRPEQFNVVYGGFTFLINDDSKTTRKAWDAFTESQLFTTSVVDSATFDPTLETACIIDRNGGKLVNTYVEINTEQKKGDVTLFLNHIKKLLPVVADQEILLAYMAACVQHKGVKFQWAPLIQGVEGNGKTLLTRCVEFAIGEKYSHFPNAADLHNKFNAWLLNKIFIGVEDIYVPQQRREVLEVLKPMITSNRLEIQMKGSDQFTTKVCCNFIFNSNHKDAIQKTQNDRRFCVFYTAQQSVEDLERDEMSTEYFKKLYNWLSNGNGYATVNEFLTTYEIADELNPALGGRAPKTSSTNQAVRESLGRVEQEIIEAVEEGRPGFSGGWISSVALDRLLQHAGLARMIAHNKRRDMLAALDYVYHPALPAGRSTVNIIMDDNKKPRLFVKRGHIACNIEIAADAVRAYRAAQGENGVSEAIGEWSNV